MKKKVLVIIGNAVALERFAREQRIRFRREGFEASIEDEVADTKGAEAADVKEPQGGDDTKEPQGDADTKGAEAADVKEPQGGDKSKKSNKK